MPSMTHKTKATLPLLLSIFMYLVFSFPQTSKAQTCVFETAADLYKADEDGPQKIYRPTIVGSDLQYFEDGSIDANLVKIKTKKALLIHDEFKGHFMLIHPTEPRCSEGSELMARPENEEIIVLTKEGEIIKGYGTIFPYSENLKIYKDEHHSGDYYRSISSTTEVVFLIYFIDQNPDTKFFVTGKDLAKYTDKLYNLLIPAYSISSSELIAATAETSEITQDSEVSNENLPTETVVEMDATEEPIIEEKIELPVENSFYDATNESSNSSTEQALTETAIAESEDIAENQTIEELPKQEETTEVAELKQDTNVTINNSEAESTQPIVETSPILKPKNKLILDDIEKEVLMVKAKEKVETLGGCFEILASTSAANSFKDDNYKLAVSLFIHDSVEVAVSSLTRNTFKHYKITTYLKRMRTFNYTDVEISFHNVSKVSNLRLNPDGTYTGIITFSQVFRGFIEGKPVYADRTDKNIEIIIRAREVFAGELEASIEWDVFLGNIGVDQTSAF